MVVEESSVIAAASNGARIVRAAGGFLAQAQGRLMIGQVQIVECPDLTAAERALLQASERLLEEANDAQPGMLARGGGAREISVRRVAYSGTDRTDLVLHLYVDTRDAMGANTVNAMTEAIAPSVERVAGGRVLLRILSNYTDRCLARATCDIPPGLLATGALSGASVRDRIVAAGQFAEADVYRAVTHNKGVMNGIDAVLLATGNDWRAIEAAAHAHACRAGRYTALTRWAVGAHGHLHGEIELPMPVGTVGGSIGVNPAVRTALGLLRVETAGELAQVCVAVGLAQNLAALRALVSEGIQRGHMALHARSVALAAGAAPELADTLAAEMAAQGEIGLRAARHLLARRV
jgi:hydroxymethylglutaryl-CoA reductase